MTQEEFEQMVHSGPLPSMQWKKAFEEYNTDNSPKLQMGCMGCYVKVQHFIAKKYSLDNNLAVSKMPKVRIKYIHPKKKRFK